MDRRAFLRKPLAGRTALVKLAQPQPTPAGSPPEGDDETVSKFANQTLPNAARAAGTLAAYSGPWGAAQAAHLLRRTTFGPTRAEVTAAAGKSLTQVLNELLVVSPAPAPPVNGFQNDTSIPVGQTWITAPQSNDSEYWRLRSLRAWWAGQQLQSTTLTEKMTLFWHNHFVAEFDAVYESRYAYRYVALLRRSALGNIKQLAKDITVEPLMLRYLGGDQNRVGAPNENYGRELLELFTVGKGPLIGAGNYTTYTEADVQAAAKVLTGWRDPLTDINSYSYYTDAHHDKTTKQFSAAFGNKTIADQGDQEYKALIDMMFEQPSTALFLVRKLYRWFVYYVIDAAAEQTIIQPLAAELRQNGYNVAPVLRKLLGSQHFFDVENMGCVIKSPLDAVLSTVRQLPINLPPATNVLAQYAVWDSLVERAAVLQQKIGDPPNVAGWPAYWQTPEYYQIWINAVTLPRRNEYTDQLIDARGHTCYYTGGTYKLLIDIVGWVQTLPAPTAADPNLLIGELVRLLVPVELTANQLEFLNDTLIPGLPDFEWTVEWKAYLAAPTNAAKRTAVDLKLRALTRQLMGLAEYHIS